MDGLKCVFDKLNELSSKLPKMSDEELKEWTEQIQNKKYVPVRMNKTGLMLPKEEYKRAIDKYLDDVGYEGMR